MVAFSGVDQATPKNAIVYANSTGTAPSANASSTSGQTVLGCEFSVEYTASSGTVTAAQTAIDEVEGADTTFETLGNSYTTASGSSTTMNWTLSITSWWSVFAFSINDAAGGGGTTLTRYWWDMIGADD
jgi:hypothetical protein